MFVDAPIRLTDPTTWPWMVYVWLAFMLGGWSVTFWRSIQRKRACNWPIASGRIESVDVNKPSFSFTAKRAYYVAVLGYSYTVAGTIHSGIYKQEFPTEHEAEEFVRGLKDEPVTIHHAPDKPGNSLLLESDIGVVQQSRTPVINTAVHTANSVPAWIRPFLWLFVWFSTIGLFISLWIHLAAIMGHRVAPNAFFSLLHIGIFVVWIPAVFVAQRLVGNMQRKDFWKIILQQTPDWMRYMMYGFFAYEGVNFLLFITKTSDGSNGTNPSISDWQGFSGVWMAFYSAALAILYSAVRTADTASRCVNGHVATMNAAYCTRCGQPIIRIR